MKNNMKRLAAIMLSTVVVASCFTGCGKNPTAAGDDAANKQQVSAEKKDSIIIATMAETPSMNPYAHNSVAGSYMNLLTYNTLFVTDADMNPSPSLVDTWECIGDTEWIFKLKPGIKFHDGSDLTAEDVVASLNYSKTCVEVGQFTRSIETAEAVDEQTVRLTTIEPSATLLYDLCSHANAVVPKELIDSGNDFNKNPIGSGPYVFKNWTLGDSITFEAFADYFGGAPAIKNMTWRIIPEGSSRTIALESGEVDMVIEVEGMDAARIKENEKLTLLEHDAAQVSWLMLNNEKPGLDNKDVRHAINSAINKDNIVTVALNGLGKPAKTQTPMGLMGESEEGADSYDVEKAKAYLAESGVNPADINLSIICSNDVKKRAGEVIQSDLAAIGITCRIESMDLATYLSATLEGNYTGSIGGYSTTDMATCLMGVYHSSSINASNMSRINNPELDALIDKICVTVDADQRKALMEQANVILNTECPNVPIYQDVYLRAYNAGLTGTEINANGMIHFENISWAE